MNKLPGSVWLTAWFCCSIAFADWSQWRGPNRDGVVSGFSAPANWPAQLKRVWRVEVGGGDASPVVGGKRVYAHTRQGEREVVTAVDLDNGRILWQDSYGDVFYMWPWHGAESRGKGPFSTPALYEGKLYTFGVTQTLSAYNAEAGELLWRKNFSKHLGFGTSTSPIVVDGYCIVHHGESNNGALTAFDAATGTVAWQWNEDGPSYASPILVELEGVRQIVAVTQKHCIGVSPTTGEVFWKIPFVHPWDENIVTPVRYGNLFILSAIEQGTRAIRVNKNTGGWSTEQVWHNPEISMYASSPVLSGDFLYGFTAHRKGQFFCLDARTGSTLWTSDGRQGEYASILSAGELLFCLTGDAELIIARQSAERFEPLARYSVADSPTWAHPVILDKNILIKDASTLTLWSLAADAAPAVALPTSEQPVLTTIDARREFKTITWEPDGSDDGTNPRWRVYHGKRPRR
jgi:outer membrane protein assembly factor BamB